MAFSEVLAERIRQRLARRKGVEEKKMFGGVGFLLHGNMLVGVWKDSLIVRLGPDEGDEALKEPHVREFDITGRAMKGWVLVEPEGVEDEEQLTDWIGRATKFVGTLLAIEQIVFARNYTLGLLDQTPTTEWFRQPAGGVSHVAWQVGHVAFSEYRLALWRIRGERPDDDALFSPEFKHLFGADSVPQADSAYPPDELRAVLDRVHRQVLGELPGLDEAELDQAVPHPHPFAKTKLL